MHHPLQVVRPLCLYGEGPTRVVYAGLRKLDALQTKYSAQWRRGIWLGKDEADMDIVAVSEKEVIKSKVVRKISEEWDASSILALEIHPWDLKKGVHSQMKPIT